MDHDAIVDQIVRSLSFEVVVVPQNTLHMDSTSKSTPLNVKIRVRKKHDTMLRHGVLSMLKVDTKMDRETDSIPERIRLVNSDQTVMSFNVMMDADFDKVPLKHRKQNLNMVSPGLEVNNKENEYQSLSKRPDNCNDLSMFQKRDIFGRCKPGGCLDPPYGEDKYSYQPTEQNASLPIKEDPTKLRSSSIFKTKIFKKKKKSSQGDDDLFKADTMNAVEDESSLGGHGTGSLQTATAYSNSIITYPHPSNSGNLAYHDDKINLKEEKSNKKRYSGENKSRSSDIDVAGSYFILPKKTRNRSNVSDLNEPLLTHTKTENSDLKIMKLDNNLIYPESKTDLGTATDSINDKKGKLLQSEKHDEKYTPKASKIIPIPLLVPLNAVMNNDKRNINPKAISLDDTNYLSPVIKDDIIQSAKSEAQSKIQTKNQSEISDTFDTNDSKNNNNPNKHKLDESDFNFDKVPSRVFSSKSESSLPKIMELNYADNMANIPVITENIQHVVEEEKQSQYENILPLHIQKSVVQAVKSFEKDNIGIKQTRLSKTTNKLITDDELSVDNSFISDLNCTDEMDIKSHPLVTTKEKSILDITTNNLSRSEKDTSTKNIDCDLKPFDNKQNPNTVSYSTDELQHLWKNYAEPLKSMADFITEITLSGTCNDEKNSDPSDEVKQHLKLEKSSYKTQSNQEDSRFEISSSQAIQESDDSNQNFFEESIEEKDSNKLQETIVTSVPEINFNRISGAHITENSIEMLDDQQFSENIEKIPLKSTNRDTDDKVKIYDSENEKSPTKNTEVIETSNGYLNEDSPTKIIESAKSFNKKSISLDFEIVKLTESKGSLRKENELIKKSSLDSQTFTVKEKADKFIFLNNSIKSESMESVKNTYFTNFIEKGENTENSIIFKNEENVKYSVPLLVANNQSDKYLNNNWDNNHVKSTPDSEKHKNSGTDNKLTTKQTSIISYLSSDMVQLEETTQYDISSSNVGKVKNTVINNSEVVNKTLQPTKILQKEMDLPLWKIDIALQSYTNEKNERVIKSFDGQNVPPRQLNDTLLMAHCYLSSDANEIKIPINQENELSVQIKSNEFRNQFAFDLTENVVKAEQSQNLTAVKMNIFNEMDPDITTEYTDYEVVNKPEANKFNKVISDDIRDALNKIYEQELLPLQDIIRGLKEEIDILVPHQLMFKEKVQKLSPKRSRPLRLVNPGKKCACVRRL